jgi:hypothetical protein
VLNRQLNARTAASMRKVWQNLPHERPESAPQWNGRDGLFHLLVQFLHPSACSDCMGPAILHNLDSRRPTTFLLPAGIEALLTDRVTRMQFEALRKDVTWGCACAGMPAPPCAVRAIRAWLEGAAIESGPVFRSVTRHGKVALRRDALDAGIEKFTGRIGSEAD